MSCGFVEHCWSRRRALLIPSWSPREALLTYSRRRDWNWRRCSPSPLELDARQVRSPCTHRPRRAARHHRCTHPHLVNQSRHVHRRQDRSGLWSHHRAARRPSTRCGAQPPERARDNRHLLQHFCVPDTCRWCVDNVRRRQDGHTVAMEDSHSAPDCAVGISAMYHPVLPRVSALAGCPRT